MHLNTFFITPPKNSARYIQYILYYGISTNLLQQQYMNYMPSSVFMKYLGVISKKCISDFYYNSPEISKILLYNFISI